MIPGDGIGREVVAEATRVLRHLGGVELEELPWGADYYLRTGTTVPPGGYDTLRSFDAIFVGALGDPRVPDNRHARDILLGTRFELDLYVNYRPVRLLDDRLCPLKNRTRDLELIVGVSGGSLLRLLTPLHPSPNRCDYRGEKDADS